LWGDYHEWDFITVRKPADSFPESIVINYTYDAVGNRLSESDGNMVSTYTYNSLNEMTGKKTSAGGVTLSNVTYSYDGAGNQTQASDSISNAKQVMTYNVDGQLKTYNSYTGPTITFMQTDTYNGSGQRISKIENGAATNYYYQGTAVLFTTDTSGSMASFNLMAGTGDMISTLRNDAGGTQDAYFYNTDVRGSTTNLINEACQAAVTYEYDDFGQTTIKGDQNFSNEICYTGGIYDKSTGLYYLNARYYDPATSRFLSQDSYRGEQTDFGTWHLFVYCANDPINNTDPSGHKYYCASKTLQGRYYMESAYLCCAEKCSVGEGVICIENHSSKIDR